MPSLVAKALLKAAESLGSAMNELRDQAAATKVKVDDGDRRRAIAEHVGQVSVWASTVGFQGWFREKRLAEVFTSVSFAIGMQPIHRGGEDEAPLTVDVIAERTEHTVILGQPGAGKTTALQRIAQGACDRWDRAGSSPPVLVCLRDLREGQSLTAFLLHVMGISVTFPTEMERPTRDMWLQRAACRAVHALGAMVLVDGLDETPEDLRERVEADLAVLVRHPGRHRIIVTCRTADYRRPLRPVQLFTILPLTTAQVEAFAAGWLGADKAPEFVRAVRTSPYAATEVVPLTLAHLAALFESHGTLPPRPVDVYELLVNLLVNRWDDQRGIRRQSKWTTFSPPKKQRCLAAIAYHLMLRDRRGSFRAADLTPIADDIRRDVGLDEVELADVLDELDSHTGIVHVLGHGQYQYVHLVMQEYLASVHAHRLRDAIAMLTPGHPNELALVVAQAADPNAFLADVLAHMLAHQKPPGEVNALHE